MTKALGVTSIYAALRQDPQTAGHIDQIQELKASTPPGSSLTIPTDCLGKAPSNGTASTGTTSSYLNGVYRYTITKEDAIAAGAGDDPDYPMTNTVWLKDGSFRAAGGLRGTYLVDGNRISFKWVDFATVNTFTFTRDHKGNLTLTPVPPMDKGDAVLWSTKPWIKIG